MLYPLTFHPIFKERIWGGRNLAALYAKALPPSQPIGESWEISDRPGDESVIARGPLQGKTLRWLMEHHALALLGPCQRVRINLHHGKGSVMPTRFPLLIKILDAQETLSLQVHPPANKAAELGGEPKTEMWYVSQAGPKAELFAGLKRGVGRGEFEKRLASQTVAECFHRIPVRAGDAMFLPSGRVHALGAETVVFEIQQNSDTTYRVFDWNRIDKHGKGRELHVEQSLASIDFEDVEPSLLPREWTEGHPGKIRRLVKNELFEVSLRQLRTGDRLPLLSGQMSIIGVTEGALRVTTDCDAVDAPSGGFCLVPAQCPPCSVVAARAVSFLEIHAG